jgi:hypothetical protein
MLSPSRGLYPCDREVEETGKAEKGFQVIEQGTRSDIVSRVITETCD